MKCRRKYVSWPPLRQILIAMCVASLWQKPAILSAFRKESSTFMYYFKTSPCALRQMLRNAEATKRPNLYRSELLRSHSNPNFVQATVSSCGAEAARGSSRSSWRTAYFMCRKPVGAETILNPVGDRTILNLCSRLGKHPTALHTETASVCDSINTKHVLRKLGCWCSNAALTAGETNTSAPCAHNDRRARAYCSEVTASGC